MMNKVDEILDTFERAVTGKARRGQKKRTYGQVKDEVKLALAVLIKAEMGERKNEPTLAYNHGLYIQIQLDREAVDRAMGIEKPQGGEVGE